MVDVKQAVKSAESYARELFGDQELSHLRLEEVEFSELEALWKVTLGWVEPAVAKPGLVFSNGSIQRLPRVYKVFEVDAETGKVRSMKIRDLE
ncbi:MAG TPA: hypothetical protein VJT67_12055 [Longimicrobiaceae bacterium]|nr:hypothetical protein [Longimicrobiaceae bacterium]